MMRRGPFRRRRRAIRARSGESDEAAGARALCGETRCARPCRPGSAQLPDGRADFRLPGCPAARLPG
ncbi:hypothetical protein EGT86_08405 [Burkholderia pseudomallei]|nr:hypothetical protein EGT86_08405 [Burkholderia pseudomallei]